jgi:putative transposase
MLDKGRHSVTTLGAHLVFVTKYRKEYFTPESLDFMEDVMVEIAQKMGFTISEFNGEADHIHLLIRYPPKYSISKMVNALKGASSRLYRTKYNTTDKHLWSPSYFASSVGGVPLETLKSYIQKPKKPS